jgi:hypothetical protein
VLFNMVKGCNDKDYSERNTAIVWERLNNMYEQSSEPSLVKTKSFLGKDVCVIMKIQILGL